MQDNIISKNIFQSNNYGLRPQFYICNKQKKFIGGNSILHYNIFVIKV